MDLTPIRPALPESLRPDARDAILPRAPENGFRNFGHEFEAPEEMRWRGLGSTTDTEALLAAIARRMMATKRPEGEGPFAAGFTYLAQFAAHDLQFSIDETIYPPPIVVGKPLRERRLTLETIYGEGPEHDPEFYSDGIDALAPYRLKVGRFGPGFAPGLRTLARKPDRSSVSGEPTAPLCAADDRNDENPIVAQITGFFMRLHNVALNRLSRYGDPRERFEAARRVTQAVYRRILFEELLPHLVRGDIHRAYCNGLRLDRWGVKVDDAPVEFTHGVIRAGHALVRTDYSVAATINRNHPINVAQMIRHTAKRDPEAFRSGRAWAVNWRSFFGPDAQRAERLTPNVNVFLAEARGLVPDNARTDRRAHLILRDLARGMESGPLRVSAIGDIIRPALAESWDLSGWIGFDRGARMRALRDWAGEDPALQPHLKTLGEEPPLYLATLIEAAAPVARGGGGGACFGALGGALISEMFHTARDLSRSEIEDHPDLARDLEALFTPSPAPASMERLISILAPDAMNDI